GLAGRAHERVPVYRATHGEGRYSSAYPFFCACFARLRRDTGSGAFAGYAERRHWFDANG
ncbi:hypothetical protein ABTP93_19750, partial [Acinetobacter baumannii]